MNVNAIVPAYSSAVYYLFVRLILFSLVSVVLVVASDAAAAAAAVVVVVVAVVVVVVDAVVSSTIHRICSTVSLFRLQPFSWMARVFRSSLTWRSYNT